VCEKLAAVRAVGLDHGLGGSSQRPSGKTKMAKLDGKSQPVMIPPVLADYLEVLVG
jgi:hypothetical protein